MHAFRQKPFLDMLGLSPLSSCPLRSPALAIRGYLRGAITTLNLLAPVQSCFSKLLARQDTHPKSLPAGICAPSQTVLFPNAEQRQG
jgi:hypothetical protein